VEREWHVDFIAEHRSVLDRLGVPVDAFPTPPGPFHRCHFTEDTARAFQLLHVLLHELGHHHDAMTTRKQRWSCRGERYAEDYALRYAERIWDRYLAAFDRR
jgi:hypothetical protein